MSRQAMLIVAVVFGIAFAASAALRGEVLPGLVTGVIGAILVFLVLKRVTEHNEAVRRRREREQDQARGQRP
jgi:L-lactate permease